MSNPGVITLSEVKTANHIFRIEDNIGEAIHLHLDSFRLDMTIAEFEDFVLQIKSIMDSMINIKDFKVDYIDSLGFMQMAYLVPDILNVKFDRVALEDLIVAIVEHGKRVSFANLPFSRVIRILESAQSSDDGYPQINLFGESSDRRIYSMLNKIKESGYPFDKKYIILFDDNNVIQDGQHRAACLYYLYGNIEIDVLRLYLNKKSPYYDDYSYVEELLARTSIEEFARNHNYLFVYGAGQYGRAVAWKLKQLNIPLSGFLVTKRNGIKTYLDYPVYEITEVIYPTTECGIIFGLSEKYHASVKPLLKEYGILSWYLLKDWEMENMKLDAVNEKNSLREC